VMTPSHTLGLLVGTLDHHSMPIKIITNHRSPITPAALASIHSQTLA